MKPELLKFSYTAAELSAIASALQAAKPWDESCVKSIREKIKKFHLSLTGDTCCYCQENLHGEFQMVIDAEHILPSSKFKPLTFEIWNLSASCKRCNMWMKNDKTDFIDQSVSNFFNSKHYLLIHPNFDNIDEHMTRFVHQEGKMRLVKYIYGTSDKAAFSYRYFHLYDLEIDTFDSAQGANIPNNVPNENFDWIKQRVKHLENKFQ